MTSYRTVTQCPQACLPLQPTTSKTDITVTCAPHTYQRPRSVLFRPKTIMYVHFTNNIITSNCTKDAVVTRESLKCHVSRQEARAATFRADAFPISDITL